MRAAAGVLVEVVQAFKKQWVSRAGPGAKQKPEARGEPEGLSSYASARLVLLLSFFYYEILQINVTIHTNLSISSKATNNIQVLLFALFS